MLTRIKILKNYQSFLQKKNVTLDQELESKKSHKEISHQELKTLHFRISKS